VRHRKDFQYKPGKDGKGKLTFAFTIQTESAIETIQALSLAGYTGINIALDFKQCLGKGQKELLPMPLLNQV
jgi:hypothetical protein